jgi:hypothetical protein
VYTFWYLYIPVWEGLAGEMSCPCDFSRQGCVQWIYCGRVDVIGSLTLLIIQT